MNDDLPISRRRLGDALDDFAEKIGHKPSIVAPGDLDDDLRAIVTGALDLGYYRTLNPEIVGDMAGSVAHELAQRALNLPEHPETTERLMNTLQSALAKKRRSTD